MNRGTFIASVGALALSACGRSADQDDPGGSPPERTSVSRQGDIELLQAAYAMELAEARAQGSLERDRRARAEQVEGEHAARLLEALRALGAEPAAPADAAAPLAPEAAEARSIAFYLDMLPKLYDPELRSLVASILAVEGQQLALLRADAGEAVPGDAFVYGTPS